ncbi:MAG: DJ-1/PfpI family protein [Sneathiella sp.]|nr:DJ-1/PfpI family protein [Sneathiella sp.]
MPSIHAKMPQEQNTQSLKIAFLILERTLALDVTGPSEAFACANQQSHLIHHYNPVYVSLLGGGQRTVSGLVLETVCVADVDLSDVDTLIVTGGAFIADRASDAQAATQWLSESFGHFRRIGALGGGVFYLAHAGLLWGRRVATHWTQTDQFRSEFLGIDVEEDSLFVTDGKFWTSAGASASIDMALAFIREDLGAASALAVAKKLIVFLQRPGGQSQFSVPLLSQCPWTGDNGLFARVNTFVAENLTHDLSNEALADHFGMSLRNFSRAFSVRADGLTAAKFVEATRVEAAQLALSGTSKSIKKIAEDCGFRDQERMRRAFIRRLGIPPIQYRNRFNANQ